MKIKRYSLLTLPVICALLFVVEQADASQQVASRQVASQFEQRQYSSVLPSSDTGSAADLYFGERFPIPKDLVPNVDFWISVYSRHTTGQWILHDSQDLGIVYGVINADQVFPGENLNSRKVDRYIKKQKKHVASLLKKIYKNKGVAVNPEEAAIANALPERLNSYSKFLKHYRNVRAQRGQSDRFREGIKRSGQYLARMRQVFRQYGLPEELTTLPHVESSFYYKAYSKAGAAGIWQFTRGTGRYYMRINYLVDERRDPVFSTHAAAKLLKKNYKALGSWPLAITAYNHGLNGMKRAVRKQGADLTKIIRKHKSRYFGFASRNFYAEFLAALEVSRNHIKYFGPVDFNSQVLYDEIVYGRYIHARDLAKVTGLSLKTLKKLNPSLSKVVWDGRAKIPSNFKLKVPEGMGSFALIALEKAPSSLSNDSGDLVHKVRRGETISAIALHYGVAIRTLLDSNNIKPRSLRVGSKILVPSPTRNLPSKKRYAKKARKRKTKRTPTKPAQTATVKAIKLASANSVAPAFLVNAPDPTNGTKDQSSSDSSAADVVAQVLGR
ncbi:MAG: transglycosylase SLT domain-containing protein, partial [Nitrospinota bacterium]|nr:transglycosylase SLT domain-containing protein [Nitrospinota bacterium]